MPSPLEVVSRCSCLSLHLLVPRFAHLSRCIAACRLACSLSFLWLTVSYRRLFFSSFSSTVVLSLVFHCPYSVSFCYLDGTRSRRLFGQVKQALHTYRGRGANPTLHAFIHSPRCMAWSWAVQHDTGEHKRSFRYYPFISVYSIDATYLPLSSIRHLFIHRNNCRYISTFPSLQ